MSDPIKAPARLLKAIPGCCRTKKVERAVEIMFYLGCSACSRRINLMEGFSVRVDRKIMDNFHERYISVLCFKCCEDDNCYGK